jgi:hypothetical protein
VSDVELQVVEGVAADRPATVRLLSGDDGQLALEAPKEDGKVQRVDFPRSLAGPIAAAVREIVSEEETEEIELAAEGERITIHPVTHPFGCDAMVENRARHPRGYAHQAQHVMLSYELAPQVADALDAIGAEPAA